MSGCVVLGRGNAGAGLQQLLQLQDRQACDAADAVALCSQRLEQGGFAQVIFAVKPVLPLRGGGRKSAVACLPNPQGGHRNAAELGNDANAIDGRGLQ